MTCQVELITDRTQVNPVRWNQLAGTRPFLRWEWLGSWWEHLGHDGQLGHDRQLYALAVRDGDRWLGLAPWFVATRPCRGRVVQFLGSGKACTDHLTLLCDTEQAEQVTRTIAEWLAADEQTHTHAGRWDHLELTGIDADDPTMNRLHHWLRQVGLHTDRRPGATCYGIPLPPSWDDYLRRRSKSGRRDCRRLRKSIEEGQFEFFVPSTIEQLEQVWWTFVDLHQCRRQALGTTGCFDHPHFGDFLWDASRRLLTAGMLQLTLVYLEGVPLAVQYAVRHDGVLYYYQSGMDVKYDHHKPGQVLLFQTLYDCIERGDRYFDMMRGDEQYKQRWRGQPLATQEIRVAAPRAAAHLQHNLWMAGSALSNWARDRLAAVHSAK